MPMLVNRKNVSSKYLMYRCISGCMVLCYTFYISFVYKSKKLKMKCNVTKIKLYFGAQQKIQDSLMNRSNEHMLCLLTCQGQSVTFKYQI